MNNVVSLKAVRALKSPLWAVCHKLENHDKAIDMLFRSAVKDKSRQKQLINAIQVLIWSNILSWLVIGAMVFALFSHSHNITSLL